MFGKAMRFATVCTLALAICGTANRDQGAADSKGTTEDLEHRLMQKTNVEDHLSTTSSCSRFRRLAVIPLLSSVVTSADTAFAPILTNNTKVSTHDIKLYANRQGEETSFTPFGEEAGVTSLVWAGRHFLAGVTPFGLAGLELPTLDDVEAFRSLNKQKDSRAMFKDSGQKTPQFNVLEEYTRRVGKVAEELHLSPEEQAALWSYTHGDADIINQIAMGADKVEFVDYSSYHGGTAAHDILCTLTKEDMLPWLKILNAGLNKMPSAGAGRLYLGVGFNVEGTPGSIAPITGFSSFSEDFNVAYSFAEEEREDGIKPTIFVMDKHSSGRHLKEIDDIWSDCKEVVFGVGTKFVIEEDPKVQREVEALWPSDMFARPVAVPDFQVLVVKEVPSDET